MTLVVILGSLMYLIEGEEHGFTSILLSIYWAIVTLTTVGYGDISPETPLGQAFAVVIMIIGYAIIAVPTGIVTVELSQAARMPISTQVCRHCNAGGHDPDARHCKYCGAELLGARCRERGGLSACQSPPVRGSDGCGGRPVSAPGPALLPQLVTHHC